jgi:hypothetical protein
MLWIGIVTDTIPTDEHGKPSFWARYACTVIIWIQTSLKEGLDEKIIVFPGRVAELESRGLVIPKRPFEMVSHHPNLKILKIRRLLEN